MKKLLAALAILTAVATPSFAQSFDPDLGTGNVRAFSPAPSAQLPSHKMAKRKGGASSFASVSGFNASSNDPTLIGGGSTGYNENLRNY